MYLKSNYVWNKEIEPKFIKWVSDSANDGSEFVLITFKARVRSKRISKFDAELVNASLISKKYIGRGLNEIEIKTGFSDFVKHLDFKYVPTSQRKKGIKLKRIPFFGGDDDAGTWNHIHAYIQKPAEVSNERFFEYMNLIAQSKMQNICGRNCIVEAEVWCKCEQIDGKFIKYALRPEGDFIHNKLDKLFLEEVYLGSLNS